jgi:hypothetical protein
MNGGVSDGIRTRDVQIHSLALYQLSYAHHKTLSAAKKNLLCFSNIDSTQVSMQTRLVP